MVYLRFGSASISLWVASDTSLPRSTPLVPIANLKIHFGLEWVIIAIHATWIMSYHSYDINVEKLLWPNLLHARSHEFLIRSLVFEFFGAETIKIVKKFGAAGPLFLISAGFTCTNSSFVSLQYILFQIGFQLLSSPRKINAQDNAENENCTKPWKLCIKTTSDSHFTISTRHTYKYTW